MLRKVLAVLNRDNLLLDAVGAMSLCVTLVGVLFLPNLM